MKVIINNVERDLRNDITIEELLKELNIKEHIAVSVNLNVIRKSNFHITKIKENDNIEIVSFVSGG